MPPKPLVSTDAGFARFLKEHSSPKHQRVTAGGRIVPMDTGDDSKAGGKDSEERRRLSRQQHSSLHQVSPSMIKSNNHPRGGNVVIPNPASLATDDQVQNGRGLLKPVPITTPQIPVTIPIPVQSFMPPVFSQQSMGIYQATGTTQQFEDGYFQTLDISPDLNFDPAGLFRSKLDQVHNIVNGLQDATLVDFKHNLRLLLDLVGRPIDSIRVGYLIYLHQQMEIALDTASRHLQSVDVEIAMRSTTSPAHVGLRIKWKRIRSEILDRLEEIKLTLGEALDQFDGVPSVRRSITPALFPVEMAFEPSVISPVPNIFYDSMPRLEEPFQQIENRCREYIMEPKREVMRLFTPNAPDFVPVSHAQISDTRHAIDHPAPERAGRFDDIGSDLYGDGDMNGSDADSNNAEFHKEENKGLGSKSLSSSNHGVGGLPITPQDLANEESSALSSESASSEVSQDIGNEETGLQVHQASEQADGVVETRIPRFLPPNMRHRDSQTLPRSFPHRLSNTKQFAAKRRPNSRYFPWNWRSTDSGSRSDLSFSDDYDEGSQLEGCDRKMNIARKWNHSEAGPGSLPNKAGYFDLSSEGSSSQG